MLEILHEPNILQSDRALLEEEGRQFQEKTKGLALSEAELNLFKGWHTLAVAERQRSIEKYGFWGDAEFVYFVAKGTATGCRVALTEELYRSILAAIKKSSPAAREAATGATLRGLFGGQSFLWSSASRILIAAQLGE